MNKTCSRCGAAKVMEDVRVNTDLPGAGGRGAGGRVPVVAYVQKDPDAWVFKGTVFGVLRARVCGGCGHTELYTTNFEELYAAYQKARGG
jgi:hypothetical protein